MDDDAKDFLTKNMNKFLNSIVDAKLFKDEYDKFISEFLNTSTDNGASALLKSYGEELYSYFILIKGNDKNINSRGFFYEELRNYLYEFFTENRDNLTASDKNRYRLFTNYLAVTIDYLVKT